MPTIPNSMPYRQSSTSTKSSIPILLIHGRDDTVVQFSQSENMAEALKGGKKH